LDGRSFDRDSLALDWIRAEREARNSAFCVTMRKGLFIVGVGLVGVYAYDFVAGKVNNSTGKDSLPQVWGVFSNPQMVNYYFSEVWLLVAGIALILLLAVTG
jgi:hypothetical protein